MSKAILDISEHWSSMLMVAWFMGKISLAEFLLVTLGLRGSVVEL